MQTKRNQHPYPEHPYTQNIFLEHHACSTAGFFWDKIIIPFFRFVFICYRLNHNHDDEVLVIKKFKLKIRHHMQVCSLSGTTGVITEWRHQWCATGVITSGATSY